MLHSRLLIVSITWHEGTFLSINIQKKDRKLTVWDYITIIWKPIKAFSFYLFLFQRCCKRSLFLTNISKRCSKIDKMFCRDRCNKNMLFQSCTDYYCWGKCIPQYKPLILLHYNTYSAQYCIILTESSTELGIIVHKKWVRNHHSAS